MVVDGFVGAGGAVGAVAAGMVGGSVMGAGIVGGVVVAANAMGLAIGGLTARLFSVLADVFFVAACPVPGKLITTTPSTPILKAVPQRMKRGDNCLVLAMDGLQLVIA